MADDKSKRLPRINVGHDLNSNMVYVFMSGHISFVQPDADAFTAKTLLHAHQATDMARHLLRAASDADRGAEPEADAEPTVEFGVAYVRDGAVAVDVVTTVPGKEPDTYRLHIDTMAAKRLALTLLQATSPEETT